MRQSFPGRPDGEPIGDPLASEARVAAAAPTIGSDGRTFEFSMPRGRYHSRIHQRARVPSLPCTLVLLGQSTRRNKLEMPKLKPERVGQVDIAGLLGLVDCPRMA